MQEQRTTVVTISRQMASGGAYIGYLVARKLGYQYVEREILRRAAHQLGVDISALSRIEERRAGFLENLIKGFAFGTPETAYIPPSRRPVYDRELFDAEADIIRALAARFDCVIVGRAGYSVLRDRPGAVHVLVLAPLDFRVKRLRQFHTLSPEEARAEIEESDRNREKFLKAMTNTDRYDARNYHLCLDSEALGFDAAVRAISDLAGKIGGER